MGARPFPRPPWSRSPLRFLLLLLVAVCDYIKCDGDCPDIHGRIISPGLHYVPGPDTCTLCICENGQPKWCKAVLCSPPQDCKSLFRQGNTCCEFICLDDALSTHPDSVLDGHQDLGLRLIASIVTIVLFLSVLSFMIYRVRLRKLRGVQTRQINEDQRSLASIGYIGGSLGYLEGVCDDAPVHFPSLWKPPGNYFPRGEAPPPYDEAVAQARAEAISIGNMSGFHRSFPLNAATNMENLMRMENNSQQRSRNMMNSDHGLPQYHSGNNNNSSAARLSTPFYLNNLSGGPLNVGDTIADLRDRQVVVMDNNRTRNFTAQHSITSTAGNNNFISTLKITSSLAAVTNRSRVSNIREQTECNRSNFLYNPNAQSSGIEPLINSGSSTQPRVLPSNPMDVTRHRTIPRMLNALDDQLKDSRNYIHLKQRPMMPKPSREMNPMLPEDVAKSLGSGPTRYSADTNNPRLINENPPPLPPPKLSDISEMNPRLLKENSLRYVNDSISKVPNEPKKNSEMQHSDSHRLENDFKSETDKRLPIPVVRPMERHPLLSLTTDTTPCGCSYESDSLAVNNDDQDDYHSECENCKSANGSRYYLDESEEGSEQCETMTLHRRPLPEHTQEDLNQLPTSLTLPVKTKRNRCPPGSRDAWFSSMPGTSSSEDD